MGEYKFTFIHKNMEYKKKWRFLGTEKAIQLVPFNFFRKVVANASFMQKIKQIPSILN